MWPLMAKRLFWSATKAMAPLFDIRNIDGRIGRRDFWRAIGSLWVPIAIAGLMDAFLFGSIPVVQPDFFTVTAILSLIVPVIVLGCRRLHDAGQSAWLIIAICVPVLGWAWLLATWCEPSQTSRTLSEQS
jgi:uncharacterized membrane protein YhaH (DUF805 family)